MIEYIIGKLARMGIVGIRALLVYALLIFVVFIAWLIFSFGK